MVELIEIPTPNVVGVRVRGKIEGEGFDNVLAEVSKLLESTDDRLRIYVEMEEFSGISLSALIKDIKLGIPNYRRFEKEAIVSDKSWLTKLADIGDKLFPSIEVKTFKPEEKEEALKWIQE